MATLKLSEYLPGYSAYLENTRLSPLTKSCYLEQLRLFIRYVQDCTLAELSPASLLDWHGALAKSKRAYSTNNQKRAALRKFLDYLDRFEESDHPARLLRALDRLEVPGDKKPKREPYSLEEVTLTRLLARAGIHALTGGRDVGILHFMWATGVRRAEVASMLFDNVDLEERVATVVGKGDKERLVVFDEECRRSLDIWLQVRDESWPTREGVTTFFIDINGYPLKPQNVSTIVRTCVEEAGLKGQVWPHLFRHTALTRLLDNGIPIQDVAKLAGHANINTTARYHHAEEARLKEVYDRATKQGDRGHDRPA
jgi:integrase/recombinase XerC